MFDFSKVYPGYINSEFILSKLSDSQIFFNYFGRFELKKAYCSKFRKDRSPSTGFFINSKGIIVYRDFATGESFDCIGFVAKLYNIDRSQAMIQIAKDFGLIDSNLKINNNPIIVKDSLEIDKACKSKTIIQFKPLPWTEDALSYWRRYDITQKELEDNSVFLISDFYINKKKIKNFKNQLRFAYLVKYNNEEFVKIYSPYDKKIKWISNIPLNIPFGIEELPFKSKTLIITKSQKDRIVLKKIFSDVLASQNENYASVEIISNIESINEHYDKKIIFWDNDQTGVDNCKKLNEKGFDYFNIPKEYYEKFNIKDASDFVLYYGIDMLVDLFKHKNIIPNLTS